MNFIQEIKEVFDGEDWCWGHRESHSTSPMTIISGSFNPLHVGHLNMANWAYNQSLHQIIPHYPVFELSIMNCDKGMLAFEDVLARVEQFRSISRDLIITRCPNFVQKAILFPECEFLVGIDTITRVGDPKYYFGSEEEMNRCFDIIEHKKCKFTVLERNGIKPDDVKLPKGLAKLCQQGQDYTPINISSTMIREGKCSV